MTRLLNLDTNQFENNRVYDWEFYKINEVTIELSDLLVKLKWVSSKNKARKLIEQGAITNGDWPYNKITNPNYKYNRKGLDNYIYVEYRSQYKSEQIQLKHDKHTLAYYIFYYIFDIIRSKYWILKDKVLCCLPALLRF